MSTSNDGKCNVKSRVGVAVVCECFAAERADGESLLLDAGSDEGEKKLQGDERKVQDDCAFRRCSVLVTATLARP